MVEVRPVMLAFLVLAACVACKKDDAGVKALDEKEKVAVKPIEPKPKPDDRTEVERICERIDVLGKEARDATTAESPAERAKCVAELEKMKKDDPEAYGCIAECARTAKDGEAAMTCLMGCIMGSKTFKGMMSAAGDK